MKLNRTLGLLMVAAATIGTGAAVAAATTTATTGTTTTTAPTGKHWHHHFGGGLVGTTLRATQQLNLTADQQASIKTILSTAQEPNITGFQRSELLSNRHDRARQSRRSQLRHRHADGQVSGGDPVAESDRASGADL